jgi:WD40 repeat protein
MTSARAAGILVLAGAAACVSKVPVTGAICPCPAGYCCDLTTQTCVAKASCEMSVGRLSGVWNACGTLGTGGPENIAISGDGNVVAFMFHDAEIAIHRIADQALIGRIAHVFQPPPAQDDTPRPADYYLDNRDLALSADGTRVAVAGDGHIAGWRVADGASLFDVGAGYTRVTFSPDGTTFLAFSVQYDPSSPTFQLRSAADGSLIHAFPAIANPTTAAAGFASGGTQIVYLAENGTILTYTADEAGTLVSSVPIAEAFLSAPRFSPGGHYLAGIAAVEDAMPPAQEVRVFDVSDGTLVFRHQVVSDYPIFAPDETAVLIYSNRSGTVPEIFDIHSGQQGFSDPPVQTTGPGVLGVGGNPAIVGDPSGVYWCQDPWEGGLTSCYVRFPTLIGQGLPFMAAAISPDGRWLATAAASGVSNVDRTVRPEDVILWDLVARAAHRAITNIGVSNLAFASDSNRLLLVKGREAESAIQEWPLDGASPSWTVSGGAWNAVYGTDAQTVAASTPDGIAIARVGDGAIDPTIAAGRQFPGAAFSRDGTELVVSGPELWRVADAHRLWPEAGAGPFAGSEDSWVALSPDGVTFVVSDFVASGSPPWNVDNPTFGVPGAANYTTETRLYRSDGASLSVLADLGPNLARRPVFAPDGAWILAGDAVVSVESSGRKSLPVSPLYVRASVSAFSPDGTIALAGEDGIVRLFCPAPM